MILSNLLTLPPSILVALLCATTASAEVQWPHNVPRHLKYFPEEEGRAKRGLDIKQKLKYEKPVGVKKMSMDEGEMFMLDNWIFASDLEKRAEEFGNATFEAESPLRPLQEEGDFFARFRIRAALAKRQFACPAGTNSCSSVGAPDVCCGTGTNCVTVNNSPGVGSVGCCPQGQTCAGSISCDTKNGYSSCPDAPNGGCCLPGFRCAGIGCAAGGTSTTYPQPSSSTPPPPSSTAIIVIPTSPSTTTTSAATCSTGFISCAASLGGGCCSSGLLCASGTSCLTPSSSASPSSPTPTSTQSPLAPIRPTSGLTTASPSPTDSICPQGFYVCSAYYPSGCCRVGRDCQTTGSCALPPSSTILNTNGVVVVAPSGASVKAGSCPSAWYSCAADRGGSCCPQGFECGVSECTATASGSGVAQKVAPSGSSRVSVSVNGWILGWILGTVGLGVGVGMVVL